MNQTEIEGAVIAVLKAKGKIGYGDLLAAVPGVSPERVAVAVWRLRNNKAIKFNLVAQPDGKPLHTVEVV